MFYSANKPLPIPQTFTSDASCEPPKKLICLAWLIEVIAVLVSASLAAHPLIAADTADTPLIEKWLGAAPFLVIAVAELTKIPVMEAMFRLKGMVLPCIAASAALLICLNTFYTVSNGFERAHTTKTNKIEAVKREIAKSDRELGRIAEDRGRLQAERDSLNQQRDDINRREQKEVSEHTERFKIGAEKGKNVSSAILTEIHQRYERQRNPVSAKITEIDTQLNSLSASALASAKTSHKARLDDLIHDNQTYRFAAMVYGYDDPTEMTAKQLNTFCFVWFGVLAFAVSTLGPLLARCYYRIKFQAAVGRTAWSRLLQAVRRLVLRLARRNKIVKTEEVERIIEKQKRWSTCRFSPTIRTC